jgi:D-tyrosyl-tRNA(Tyr) deacylase
VIALIQRVLEARVEVAGELKGRIGQGLLVLVCAEPTDTEAVAHKLVEKLLKLRIFSDAEGRMNLSVRDVMGGLLIVSQFTLAADTSRGTRPSFAAAAPASQAEALYETVLAAARAAHPSVQCGVFGADMQVHLINDGPVTVPMQITA